MNAFDSTVARVNEIADRDCPDREKVWDCFVAILDPQLADLIRDGELRKSGFTETADLLDDALAEAKGARDDYEQLRGFNAELANERDQIRQELDEIRLATKAAKLRSH